MRKYLLIPALFLIFPSALSAAEFFNRDLYFGLRNDLEVAKLQRFLTNQTAYSGPITGNFFSLTLEGVKGFQEQNNIAPVAGYFGPKTRAAANQKIKDLEERIAVLLQQVEALKRQLADSQKQSGAATVTPVVLVPEAPQPPPKLTVNDLNFKVDFTLLQQRNYLEFPLLSFMVETKENIAITRLRFTQAGTLKDTLISDIRLFDAGGGSEILLAKVKKPTDGIIEFNLTSDDSKPNKGLVVPGRQYRIVAVITVDYGAVKPTVSLELKKASDISAFDFNNLDRSAEVSASVFPVSGPVYTISVN